jgi:hypothetical protein
MSTTAEVEQLQKKRTELADQWAFLELKRQAMKEDTRKLVEKEAVLLEKKREALEKLESELRVLERKLVEGLLQVQLS